MRRLSPVLMLLLLMMSSLSFLVSAKDSSKKVTESIFDPAYGRNLEGVLLAAAAIVAGGVIVAMGYRLFRTTLFTIGFVVGGVINAIIVENVIVSYAWHNAASWIAFIIGGLVAGSLVMKHYLVGMFVVGGTAGIVGAMIIHNSVGYAILPNHPEVILIVLCVVLCLIGGVLAIKLEKPFLIAATSFFGAAILAWGVGYFANDFPSANDLKRYASKDANGDWVYSIPSAWWGYVAGINVLLVLGIFIQRKIVRDGIYHKPPVNNTAEVPYVKEDTPTVRGSDLDSSDLC